MNYQNVYNSIISNAKNVSRIKSKLMYFERHHILPKCLGGSDDADNLVLLTTKEHFICHKLLTKIYPKNNSLRHAYWMMCNMTSSNQSRYKVPASSYERAKEAIREIKSQYWKDKSNNPNYTNPKLGEKNGMFGVHRFGSDNPFFGKTHSLETKNAQSLIKKEYYKTNVNKTKDTIWINDGISNRRHPTSIPIPNGYKEGSLKRECPHCKILVGGGNAKCYHFDNCKSKMQRDALFSLRQTQ